MSRLHRHRPSTPMIVSLVALFVALGGGAYAAVRLPSNSVGTKQLKRGAVTPAKLARSTIARFKGQRGARGPTGERGPQGVAGAKGDSGTNGVQGPTGPSDGFARQFTGTISGFTSETTITTLSGLPAGSYLIEGKVTVSNTNSGTGDLVTCKLVAGTDSGQSTAILENATLNNANKQTLPLELAHTFAAGGSSVNLSCNAGATTDATDASIQAIRVGSLTVDNS